MSSLLQPTALQPFFEWMQALPISTAISESVWFYAVDQVVHLIAVAVFIGAVLIVDFRVLGRGARQQPLAQVAHDAQPWLLGSLLVLLVTGIPQLISTAMKEFYSPMFWLKMELLAVAIVFTFTIRHKMARADEARLGRVWPKVVAIVSIGLWTGVAMSARLIGLLS